MPNFPNLLASPPNAPDHVREAAHGLLLGLAVGDALGVPLEFQPRERRKQDPVTGMRAFGTHQQLAGTFSDDSSLAFVWPK